MSTLYEKCAACRGTGMQGHEPPPDDCDACSGRGAVRRRNDRGQFLGYEAVKVRGIGLGIKQDPKNQLLPPVPPSSATNDAADCVS